MYDQPRYKPLAGSDFFADGRSARPQVEGTIARGHLDADIPLATGKEAGGKEAGQLVSKIPEAVWQAMYERNPSRFDQPLEQIEPSELRRALLERGRERFDIYCSVCHSRVGDGNGMIVQRGFRKPPSFHIDRLRNAPDGHFFDVVTNGFGAMPSYASRVDVDDRWAIVAYIRALQLSENARIDDVPESERQQLTRQTPAAGAPAAESSVSTTRRPGHDASLTRIGNAYLRTVGRRGAGRLPSWAGPSALSATRGCPSSSTPPI